MDSSPTYLQNGRGEPVEADLWDDITDQHLKLWRETWSPIIKRTAQRLKRKKIPKEKWPQDLHWDWRKKADWSRGLLALHRFALTCDGNLQGMMLVNVSKLSGRLPSQTGKDLAYVEFLSTAPWNRPDLTAKTLFRGVGLNMLRAAVELSVALGFRGRIALHSLPQADCFYGEKCRMTGLGKDPAYHNLSYFEMSEDQASEFRT